MPNKFSEFCIYTIKSPDLLTKALKEGVAVKFSERRKWVTGYNLWMEAKKNGIDMPLLFGNAVDCSELLYCAVIVDITVDKNETYYTVKNLRKLKGHSTQELVLRKTGQKIAPGFIRPYAICRTPRFI